MNVELDTLMAGQHLISCLHENHLEIGFKSIYWADTMLY